MCIRDRLILEDISTGASNDLQQATNIARQMITKYGFSERLGPVVYGTSQEETFLGRDFTQGKGYSESTAAEIDGEMRDIIDEAYELSLIHICGGHQTMAAAQLKHITPEAARARIQTAIDQYRESQKKPLSKNEPESRKKEKQG